MTDTSNVQITIAFIDQNLDADGKDQEVNRLLPQLKELVKDLDEKTTPSRMPDPNPPAGSKPGLTFLPGWLTAKVKPENLPTVVKFLREKLGNKPIKMNLKITPDSREINLETGSKEDFEFALQKVQDFINNK
jgi:hypothetical protein